tara:strand:- start:377 stop:682 length:306 start_codon:yes stop_codon:yes gene_type:complete
MQTKTNKSNRLTNQTISLILTAITSILQPFTSTTPVQANPSELRRRPIKIDVEKVEITDEDVDEAIRLCLVKEGILDPKLTTNVHPSTAQAFVMATICGQQ